MCEERVVWKADGVGGVEESRAKRIRLLDSPAGRERRDRDWGDEGSRTQARMRWEGRRR
jgi:hypothetical protein